VEEIELDLDPRDITDTDQFISLLSFMLGLSDALGKEIRLTPENMEWCPYFSYTPEAKRGSGTRERIANVRVWPTVCC
jgi:hypothetical protein